MIAHGGCYNYTRINSVSGRGTFCTSGTNFKRRQSQSGPGVKVRRTHIALPIVSVPTPVSVYTASIPFLCSLRGRMPSPPHLHHVSIRIRYIPQCSRHPTMSYFGSLPAICFANRRCSMFLSKQTCTVMHELYKQ